MIIFIHKKDTLRIMVTNKQQSPNLRMPVESYKKLIRLTILCYVKPSDNNVLRAHMNAYILYVPQIANSKQFIY